MRSVATVVLAGSLLCGAAGGCWPLWGGGAKQGDPTTQQWKLGGGRTQPGGAPRSIEAATAPDPFDPQTTSVPGVEIKVFAVVIPRGAVSANEAFWKRIDENAVDPARYQLLFSNGFRVGVARQEDWGYFRDLLDRYPVRHQLNVITAFDETRADVPVRKGIGSQTLTFFGTDGGIEMRSHVECDNVLSFSFVPAPRRRDAARVAVTPVVREQKERLSLSNSGEETALRYAAASRMYPLSLAVEVPFGQFMVVSPSTDVALETSIGRNFMLIDGDAEQSEMVLLIVPNPVEGKRAPDPLTSSIPKSASAK